MARRGGGWQRFGDTGRAVGGGWAWLHRWCVDGRVEPGHDGEGPVMTGTQ